MHELSIAQALVEQVEEARRANNGDKVLSVRIRVGEWQQVVPEILTAYFDYLAQDTPLEAARITIDAVSATARCDDCDRVFAVPDIFLICPACGSRSCTLLTGKEMELIEVELDD
jgi:hydrogenase nickel incorporation protein HypA/HybF